MAQALLQTQSPDLQAKLLAMQRQMHNSNGTSDDIVSGRMSPPVLPLRIPALAAQEARLSKLTSEQKEEQTRYRSYIKFL